MLVLLQLLSAEAQAIGHLLSRDTRLRRPSVVLSSPALLVFRRTSVVVMGGSVGTTAGIFAPVPTFASTAVVITFAPVVDE